MTDTHAARSTGRLNMRVTPEQESLLRAAAVFSGESLSGFVLSAATHRAREVVAGARRIALDGDALVRFVQALDDAPEDLPVLRRYADSTG